ncbi:hypothetical protein KGF54_004591 [Candida jiufengensis]|uniref:uncharacterized protein n=1 Tax=Candida jiufengensis TaxID=497108 RepID=UPI002225484D|nr:uncharacterized protein KGF54_004591 [Candida jiufengensis]KAI5951517.1 hypothetical protein KGF54_004591 [Candida jiufengensis]
MGMDIQYLDFREKIRVDECLGRRISYEDVVSFKNSSKSRTFLEKISECNNNAITNNNNKNNNDDNNNNDHSTTVGDFTNDNHANEINNDNNNESNDNNDNDDDTNENSDNYDDNDDDDEYDNEYNAYYVIDQDESDYAGHRLSNDRQI